MAEGPQERIFLDGLIGGVRMPTGATGEAGSPASTWAPLRIGAFRALLLAALASNIGTWMQVVGAQWFLVENHAGATAVALVQTASLSPTLVLALFAGALADRVDRRRLLIVVQAYAAAAAAVLTGIAFVGLLQPTSLLVLIFAIGCAAAFTTPAWQAIQPELVPREQVPAAASLTGVAVDAARAIGPPIAGILVAAAGSAAVFALNAVSFVVMMVVLLAWKRPAPTSIGERKPLGRSILEGVRYVRGSRPAGRILLRAAFFAVPASALWALLPLVARDQWNLRAIGYGAVLGTAGVGAVLGALVNARLRAAYSANLLLALAAFVMVAGLLSSAYLPLAPGVVMLLLSGMAWIVTLTILTAAAQLAFPQWLLARGMAMYLVILIGGQALGSFVWGLIASRSGLALSLTVAAALLMAVAVSTPFLPLLAEPGHRAPAAED
jgi:predicted MFS family arabinose efflux permease